MLNSQCYNEKDFKTFSATFGIDNKTYDAKEGNTIISQTFLVLPSKKITISEAKDFINLVEKKLVNDVNLMKRNTRFSPISQSASNFIDSKEKICKIFTGSVKDYKAANAPAKLNYLVQTDLYKVCYMKNYNLILDFAISYRVTPEIFQELRSDEMMKPLYDVANQFSFNNKELFGDVLK